MRNLALAAIFAIVVAFVVISTVPRAGGPFSFKRSTDQTASAPAGEGYNATFPMKGRETEIAFSQAAPMGFMFVAALLLGSMAFVAAKIVFRH
jgi:hypothetical protein